MTSPPPTALRLELDVPAEARVAPVPILLRVTNVHDRAVDLYLRGREITFDVIATREDGEVVWRLLEGAIVPAIVRIETIEPNAPLELRAIWPLETRAGAPVPPGVYTLTGVLLTDGPALRTPSVMVRVLSG
jgi:hypothetical protein